MPRQTLLPVDFQGESGFETYVAGRNRELVEELRRLVEGKRDKRVAYLWGEAGCGKTHLLQACCNAAAAGGGRSLYLSLGQQQGEPKRLDGTDPDSLVAIDDLQLIAGDEETQVGVLSLYERLNAGSGKLVVSADVPLVRLGLKLRDLESRLSSGGVYQVLAPGDAEKREALRARALGRGISLDDHVMDFIMSHYQRDTRSLFALLDRLDGASLETHRRITIPFVRQFL